MHESYAMTFGSLRQRNKKVVLCFESNLKIKYLSYFSWSIAFRFFHAKLQ